MGGLLKRIHGMCVNLPTLQDAWFAVLFRCSLKLTEKMPAELVMTRKPCASEVHPTAPPTCQYCPAVLSCNTRLWGSRVHNRTTAKYRPILQASVITYIQWPNTYLSIFVTGKFNSTNTKYFPGTIFIDQYVQQARQGLGMKLTQETV